MIHIEIQALNFVKAATWTFTGSHVDIEGRVGYIVVVIPNLNV